MYIVGAVHLVCVYIGSVSVPDKNNIKLSLIKSEGAKFNLLRILY